MRVMVLGQNGREHALAWKLAQSPNITKLYIAPGNPGTAQVGENVPCNVLNPTEVAELTKRFGIDLLIVGPEAPLERGVADEVRNLNPRCAIFGPTRAGARLEWSKAYSKGFMRKYGIPTADYSAFTDANEALVHLSHCKLPVVIKADGLAAGKGVVIAFTREQALAAPKELPQGHFLVIEEFLLGREVSIFALTDGTRHIILEAAEDHKQLLDGDHGPNTGGMGAYSPVDYLDEELILAAHSITEKTLKGLREEGADYRGVIYLGLMLTAQGVKVLEYNSRFGDPECQVLMLRMESDLLAYLYGAAQGVLPHEPIKWSKDYAALVVACGGDYPEASSRGQPIEGLEKAAQNGRLVFHAGTALQEGALVTNGGRILNVASRGETLEQALKSVYEGCREIHFERMHFRQDIGRRRGVGLWSL